MDREPTRGRVNQLCELADRIRRNRYAAMTGVPPDVHERLRQSCTVANAEGVRFQYGPTENDTVNVSVREWVAIRLYLRSLGEQLAGGKYLRRQSYTVPMDFNPTDATIEAELRKDFGPK